MMQNILNKVPDIIQLISLCGMVISVVATVIVRITPSKVDDEVVSSITSKFLKVLHWLPTIGVNPQTAKLEAAYEELKMKNEELKGKDEPTKTS